MASPLGKAKRAEERRKCSIQNRQTSFVGSTRARFSVYFALRSGGQGDAARCNQGDVATTTRRPENRRAIAAWRVPGAPKIDPKSIPGPSRATPEHPGTIRSAPDVPHGRPERAPGAPGRPPKSSKVAPECQKGRPGASGSAPRRPKSTLNRVRKRKSRAFIAQRNREALTERSFLEFCRFLAPAQNRRKLFRAARATRNRVRQLSKSVDPLERRNLEKRRKWDPKSTQNRSKIARRAPRATFSVDFRAGLPMPGRKASRAGSIEAPRRPHRARTRE